MVDRIFITVPFLNGVKTLQKQHKTAELKRLAQIIADREQQKVTTAYDNHALGGSAKLNDIHISGNIILLYRYETDIDNKLILTVSLRLDNIVDHKQLQKAKQHIHDIKQVAKPPVKIKTSK